MTCLLQCSFLTVTLHLIPLITILSPSAFVFIIQAKSQCTSNSIYSLLFFQDYVNPSHSRHTSCYHAVSYFTHKNYTIFPLQRDRLSLMLEMVRILDLFSPFITLDTKHLEFPPLIRNIGTLWFLRGKIGLLSNQVKEMRDLYQRKKCYK